MGDKWNFTADNETSYNCADSSINASCIDWIIGSNNTTNESDFFENKNGTAFHSFLPSPLFQAIIYGLYSLIFVFALVGNMVVCAVVFTSIRKWTVTNFFIVNMAAGDILMAFFCIPFTFVPTFVLLYWPFGTIMCRIVSFSQAVSVFVSAYTMVAISSDRYLAIVYPLRPRMTRNQAKWIIFFVWVVAGVTALPILIVSELVIPKDPWHEYEERYVCQEMWDDMDQQKQYTYVILVLQYILPVAVLVFTYGRIVGEIWGKKTPGEAHQHRDLRLARSKRKMIKMMIIVVAFFAFCWLPINLMQIIGDQYPEIWQWKKINYVAFVCHWLAMSHSAYNPIIYCCFNSKFRQGFQSLAILCGCQQCASYGMDTSSNTDGGVAARWIAGGAAGNHTAAGGAPPADCPECTRIANSNGVGAGPARIPLAGSSSLQRLNTYTSAAGASCYHYGRRSNQALNHSVTCNKHHNNHSSRALGRTSGPQQLRLVNQQHPEIIGVHRGSTSNGCSEISDHHHPMMLLSPPPLPGNLINGIKNPTRIHHHHRIGKNKKPKLIFRASNNFNRSSSSGGGNSGGERVGEVGTPSQSVTRLSSPATSPVTGGVTMEGDIIAESKL